MEFLLWPLSDVTNIDNFCEALAFGNHRGIEQYNNVFEECLDNDVHYGYSLVLPQKRAIDIPGLLIASLNVIDQNTINSCGKIVEKNV